MLVYQRVSHYQKGPGTSNNSAHRTLGPSPPARRSASENMSPSPTWSSDQRVSTGNQREKSKRMVLNQQIVNTDGFRKIQSFNGLPSAKLGSKNPIGWFLEGCSTGRFIKGRIKCANHSHSRANMLISRRENRRLRTRLGKNGNGSICVSSHIWNASVNGNVSICVS